MAAAFGNPDTQREQAVYQIMGIPLGKGGVDGIRGADTIAARGVFAERLGIDPKNEAKIQEALTAKLSDPFTRDQFLRLMSNTATSKINPNDAKAAQWLIKESGRDMTKSVDPLTGLMDGKIREDSRSAISEVRRRPPSEADVNQYAGPNARFVNDLLATNGWYDRNKNSPNVQAFDRAAAGPTAPTPEAAPVAAAPALNTAKNEKSGKIELAAKLDL